MHSLDIFIYQHISSSSIKIKLKDYKKEQAELAKLYKMVKHLRYASHKKVAKVASVLREKLCKVLSSIKPTEENCNIIEEVLEDIGGFHVEVGEDHLKNLIYLKPKTIHTKAIEAPHSIINKSVYEPFYPVYVHKVTRYPRHLVLKGDKTPTELLESLSELSFWLSPKVLSHAVDSDNPDERKMIKSKVVYVICFDNKDQQLCLIRRINETQLWDSARKVEHSKAALDVIKKLTEEIKGQSEPEMITENLILS